MTNKKRNTLLMGMMVVVAFAVFAFTTPNTATNVKAEQNIGARSLSMNANIFPANLVSAKCGSEEAKTTKITKTTKTTKIDKKVDSSKATDGKCGVGKCGVNHAKLFNKTEKMKKMKGVEGKSGSKDSTMQKKL